MKTENRQDISSLLLLPADTFATMVSPLIKPNPLPPGIEGSFKYVDTRGQFDNGQLIYNLSTNIFHRLCDPVNKPISAKSLAYFFSGIQWSAGKGWPTYSERCPRSDTLAGDPFPNAKRHMLIVQFGGYYWDECSTSNIGVGKEITDVFVGPNDDQIPDNTGIYRFVITGIGQ